MEEPYPMLYLCRNTMPWVVCTLSLEGLWPQKHIALPVVRFSVVAGVVGREVEMLGDVGTLVTSGGARINRKARINQAAENQDFVLSCT